MATQPKPKAGPKGTAARATPARTTAAKATTGGRSASRAKASAPADAGASDERVDATEPPPPPPPAVSRTATSGTGRLMRSRTDRVLGGVAGGIGQHLGIDPIIIRLVFVVLVLAGGSGLLAYLIAWVVIPAAPAGAEEEAPAPAGRPSDPDSTARIAGLGLIALGALLLAERLLPAFSWRLVAPLLLIALGILLLLRRGASR